MTLTKTTLVLSSAYPGLYKLAGAVFEEAIRDLESAAKKVRKYPQRHYSNAQTARIWVMDVESVDYPLSFANVCSVLSLNPRAIRDRLKRDGLLDWDTDAPDIALLTSSGQIRHYGRLRGNAKYINHIQKPDGRLPSVA